MSLFIFSVPIGHILNSIIGWPSKFCCPVNLPKLKLWIRETMMVTHMMLCLQVQVTLDMVGSKGPNVVIRIPSLSLSILLSFASILFSSKVYSPWSENNVLLAALDLDHFIVNNFSEMRIPDSLCSSKSHVWLSLFQFGSCARSMRCFSARSELYVHLWSGAVREEEG